MLEMQALSFDWARSYDTKVTCLRTSSASLLLSNDEQDWGLLASTLTSELQIDFSEVTGSKWEAMSRDEFIAMISDRTLLGNELISTHHLLGASKYEMRSETSAIGLHQIRAAHQRYTDLDDNTVVAKGHGHGLIQHQYLKTLKGWRISGIRPTVYWNEHDFDRIFVRSAANHD